MTQGFFESNLFGLYFLYGLSFYTMGLAIAVQYRSYSTFRLAHSLSLLAAFGVFHGLSEWGNVFVPMQVPVFNELAAWKLVAVQRLFQATSNFFLFSFGVKLLKDTRGYEWVSSLPPFLFLIWLVDFAHFIPHVGTPELINVLGTSEVSLRYLLALPGGLVTAYALAIQAPELRTMGEGSVVKNLWIATGAFILFAVFSGLVVPQHSFFPASMINTANFKQYIGLPVEVFRTITAFATALSISRILGVFDLEKQKRIDSSKRLQTVLIERERISRDLHDGVIQSIYGVGLTLQSANLLVQKNSAEATRRLNYSMQRLNEIVQALRGYIQDLHVQSESLELEQMLKSVIAEFRDDYSLDIHFNYEQETGKYLEKSEDDSTDRMYHIGQIIREALNNVVRHSKAEHVEVRVVLEGDRLVFSVEDDGQGYHLEESRKTNLGPGHHGIRNMRERAHLLGGELYMKSILDRGLEVRLELPILPLARQGEL
ncbi:MAG: sensor histidine kinase [Bacillota bacterium]